MFPFAAAAIRRFNETGLAVIVITNQSGVGRGHYPEAVVYSVHKLMTQQLVEEGAHIDAIYYCPHTSAENCSCRKPKTGMLVCAATEHHLDLDRSFVVGDRYGDVQLAHNVRARSILVRTGYGEGELASHAPKWAVRPDFIANTLSEAADWILRQAS
jgi:histidinol-phosphate phosphatase family protein